MPQFYFDAHCDTLSRLTHTGASIQDNDFHISLNKASVFAHYAQVFAIFNDAGASFMKTRGTPMEFSTRLRAGEDVLDYDGAYKGYLAQRDTLRALLAQEENRLALCLSADDMERAWAEGKRAAILAVEGAEQLEKTTLADAYADGVRLVTLTWNYPNSLGGSCLFGGGLTEKGRAFVHEANRLGVAIDLSHGAEQLFWDTLEESRRPILASHSNARTVCGHCRNLTDEQFMALVKAGGTAGINLYAEFLSKGKCTLSDVLAHIEHFFSLGGEDSVTLGTDFDGCDRVPEEIASVADMPKLADALASHGYTDEQIEKIFYKNLLRVFREATAKVE